LPNTFLNHLAGKVECESSMVEHKLENSQVKDPIAVHEDLFEEYYRIRTKDKRKGAQIRKRLVFILKSQFSYTTTQSAQLLKCSGTTIASDLKEFIESA
jgi:hypothetical protein